MLDNQANLSQYALPGTVEGCCENLITNCIWRILNVVGFVLGLFCLQDRTTQLFNSNLLRFPSSISDKIVSDCTPHREQHAAFSYP